MYPGVALGALRETGIPHFVSNQGLTGPTAEASRTPSRGNKILLFYVIFT